MLVRVRHRRVRLRQHGGEPQGPASVHHRRVHDRVHGDRLRRAPRDPPLGAVRRPAAAADRDAAQRARHRDDLPAQPGGPRRQPERERPYRSRRSARRHDHADRLLGDRRRRASWRSSCSSRTSRCCSPTPTCSAWSGIVLIALPALLPTSISGVAGTGAKIQVSIGGLLHPAGGVREAAARRVLRRLPGGQRHEAVAAHREVGALQPARGAATSARSWWSGRSACCC